MRESTGVPAAPSEPRSNGTHEQEPTAPAPGETAAAAPEWREPPREAPEAPPARPERAPAPIAHFEPSPPIESNTPRETKPYVVWSSAPPDAADKVVSSSGRGSEE
jgi:hypothetical protein